MNSETTPAPTLHLRALLWSQGLQRSNVPEFAQLNRPISPGNPSPMGPVCLADSQIPARVRKVRPMLLRPRSRRSLFISPSPPLRDLGAELRTSRGPGGVSSPQWGQIMGSSSCFRGRARSPRNHGSQVNTLFDADQSKRGMSDMPLHTCGSCSPARPPDKPDRRISIPVRRLSAIILARSPTSTLAAPVPSFSRRVS